MVAVPCADYLVQALVFGGRGQKNMKTTINLSSFDDKARKFMIYFIY